MFLCTGENLPNHVGFPIGEEYGGANYFVMEIHYDNPSLKPGEITPLEAKCD